MDKGRNLGRLSQFGLLDQFGIGWDYHTVIQDLFILYASTEMSIDQIHH